MFMSIYSISVSKLLFRTIMYSMLLIPVFATAQLNANISRDSEKKGFMSLAGSYGQVFERTNPHQKKHDIKTIGCDRNTRRAPPTRNRNEIGKSEWCSSCI